jgi:hypothetical protein
VTAAELLERLDGAKRRGDGWIAKCPAHDDAHASLSVSASSGGELLAFCHAGCTFELIIAAVPAPPRQERVVDAVYPYQDENGQTLVEVVRYRPKDFRQRKADGTWSVNGVRKVPYRLPELLASTKPGVVIVEGERDVDRLAALGIVATCNPGGAGKWRDEFADYLRGKQVVIIPDNDPAGRAHAADVARSLDAIADVRLLELDLPPKGDVSTWLDAGGSFDELRRRLVDAQPFPYGEFGPATSPEPSRPETVSIGDRTAADLRHGLPPAQLVDAFLTAEGPTVVYARGGTGKGMFACWLITRLVGDGHVVMVLDYEGHEREWGSRLRGLGLDADGLTRVPYRAPFGPDWTAPTGALSVVADAVRQDAERLGVSYVVVDSYTTATSNGDTMGGEQAAREYFSALSRIGLPSLTIAHVRGDSGRFPERPFGSVHVHNLARETWAAEQLGEAPTF